jgi:hypothetical protein
LEPLGQAYEDTSAVVTVHIDMGREIGPCRHRRSRFDAERTGGHGEEPERVAPVGEGLLHELGFSISR